MPSSPQAATKPVSDQPIVTQEEQPAQAQGREHQTAGPKRLLIIEDDQYFADILEAYAKERGFETLVARHGDTGLQMAMDETRSEEHTSELQSLMRNSYAVFCLKKKQTRLADPIAPHHLTR